MADKPITDLVAASQITETDLFVLEQSGTAKKLTGRVLFNWLMSMVDGHGGIRNIEKTDTEGLTDTYRITFSDGSTFSYNIANGRSIQEISLLGKNGLVDDYAIRFNDGSDYQFSVTNGEKGDPGEKTYLWIKYASQMPTEESHSFGDEPDRYIGVYWGDLPTAPTEWHLYKWSKIQGDQGEPGSRGNPGVTPHLSIGVVTTVDANQQASASIVGSAENPILNLSLPRGRPGADGSGSSDWNVNAPGANGYVYNRTHYVEDEETLAFDGNYEFSGNSVSIPVSLSTEKIGAEKNYRVVFSGLSYDLIMRDVSPVFSQKTFAFGNLRLIHSSFEDTGEPFCIKYIFPTETIEIVSPDSSGRSVPVAVYYGEEIVKLDNKFIDADWMAKKTIVGVTGVVLDTTTVSFASSTIIDGFAEIAIVAGGEYIVTWNNVDYTVTAYETDGFVCLGNSVLGGGHVETDEPFYIASLGGPRCMVFKTPEVQQTITMKIVGNGKTVYSKLPNEYLPDDIVSDELIAQSVEDYLEENQISAPEISLDDFEQNGRTGTVITVTETKPGMLPSISEAYVYNGTNGTSAYATVTKENGVATITTTDATGTHTAEIYDGGNGNYVSVEPAEDDIPKVFFGGALQQTKDEAVVPFRYISKTDDFSGYAEIKAQGNSSMSYPKKNQTVKMFADADCTEKLKVDFKGWSKQNKHVYKANWIDLTHARNVVSARLWADIVKSRADYAALPELLRTSPNQGAVDGFPVKLYANGEYQGRYTLNIPKDAWMANMDDELDNHCILCGEGYVSGCFREASMAQWTDEVHDSVPASISTRWLEIINFVMTSTDDEFVAGLGAYFDIPSLIDYHLFGLASCGLDAYGKNQLYMTYDGQKWFASMYDMDSTWGLMWNGSSIVSTDYPRTSYQDFDDGAGNLLYIRLEQLFHEELKSRWSELKNGALSIANIINRFERFTDIAPAELVAEDYASTTASGAFAAIPSKDTNNIQQIRSFAAARQIWTSAYVAGLPGTTLQSISVAYVGGDVEIGTALTDLTGITVTATYSDGSTATVSDYTLSGTIAEGQNTITVNYAGKTATFTVTGVSGADDPDPVVTYTITNNLTNVTSNNSATSAQEGTGYSATLTAGNGYTLDTVTVTMGGEDITATAYANGVVTIASVTGDVVITATASAGVDPDAVNYVKSLNSTGTQYIDTGLVAARTHTYEISYHNPTNTSYEAFFGSHNSGVYFISKYNAYMNVAVFGKNFDTSLTHAVDHVFRLDVSGQKLYMDGADITPEAADWTGTSTATQNILIFQKYKSGTSLDVYGTFNLYYFKVWDNGELIMELKPCLDGSGIACLFDTVSKKYLYNAGTGAFEYEALSE